MNEKQKQEVGNNSTAIQVNGDYVINPAYDQVRAIFMDLFDLNFPRVQDVAKREADIRIQELLNTLQKSFIKHQDTIDVNKFNDPGIQYEMQEMTKNVARFGKKGNIELLCELFSNILDADCPDVVELIAGETLKILPQINKKHLSFLSVMIVTFEASVNNPNLTITDIDELFSSLIPILDAATEISGDDISYLNCINCIRSKGITHINVNPTLITSNERYSKMNSDEVRKEAESLSLNNVLKFYELMQKCQIGRYDLTPIGRLIGWLNIDKLSSINIKDLFK